MRSIIRNLSCLFSCVNLVIHLAYAGQNHSSPELFSSTEKYKIHLIQEIYERNSPSNLLQKLYTIRAFDSLLLSPSGDRLKKEAQKIVTESPLLNTIEITQMDSNAVEIQLKVWVDSLHYSLNKKFIGHFTEGSYEDYKKSQDFTIELDEEDQLEFNEMMTICFNIEIASQIERTRSERSKRNLQIKSYNFNHFTASGKTRISGRPTGIIMTHPNYSFEVVLNISSLTEEDPVLTLHTPPLPPYFAEIEEIDLLS